MIAEGSLELRVNSLMKVAQIVIRELASMAAKRTALSGLKMNST